MDEALIQPVILSGGPGTRLWPLSRPERPKQLLSIIGDRTMLELTAARVADSNRHQPPIVVCGAAHADEVGSQLTNSGSAPTQLIVEPMGRNTAPAIALAAASVAPETVMLVMPSDHVIADVEAFRDAVDRALGTARNGDLVTFGVKPDRPETGFGYIRVGEELSEGVHRVAAFTEKPNSDTARHYVTEGYLWNAGIFLFRAKTYLETLAVHAPEIFEAATKAMEGARRDGTVIHPAAQAFAAAPSISIDYAVLEKVDRVAVTAVDMGWSDVGSWDAVHALKTRNAAENAVWGDVVALDSKGSLLVSDGPIVAALGVKDLVIVASADHVLVLPRSESQRVREIVELLKKRGG